MKKTYIQPETKCDGLYTVGMIAYSATISNGDTIGSSETVSADGRSNGSFWDEEN